MGFTEKLYKANNGTELTYIEDPYPFENSIGESKILFVFQSLGDEKSEDPVKRFPYTLLSGLRYFNCRKIYIKDDKEIVGNYYLGSNGSFDTKHAVIELMTNKIREYKILMENVTLFGFSKGGYAALLFGHEISVGAVICAVPQFDLVKWIDKYKSHLSYIYPENPTEEQKSVYASYLKEIIEKSIHSPKRIYIITSHNDDTYIDHIPPLILSIQNKGQSNLKTFHNDEFFVTRHNNVVKNSMNEILAILSYELSELRKNSFFM